MTIGNTSRPPVARLVVLATSVLLAGGCAIGAKDRSPDSIPRALGAGESVPSTLRQHSVRQAANGDWLIRADFTNDKQVRYWTWSVGQTAILPATPELWAACASPEISLNKPLTARHGQPLYEGEGSYLSERTLGSKVVLRRMSVDMPYTFGAYRFADEGWIIAFGTDSTRRTRENPGSLGANPFGTTDVYFEAPKRLLLQVLDTQTGQPLGPVVRLLDADGVFHDRGSHNGKTGGVRIELADGFPGVIVHGAEYEMWVFPRASLFFADRDAPSPAQTPTPKPAPPRRPRTRGSRPHPRLAVQGAVIHATQSDFDSGRIGQPVAGRLVIG